MTRVFKFVLLASLIGNLTIIYVGYKAVQYRSYINYWLDKYSVVVEEFSGRSTFAGENAVIEPPLPDQRRVVFLGTQVTRRWQVDSAFSGWQAVNRGVDGQRLPGFLLRFYPDVIDLGAHAVVVEVSSYNFRPGTPVRELKDYVASLADLARANDIVPIIGSVIPAREGAVDLDEYRLADSVAVFNSWLRAGAADGIWRLADFSVLLADEKGFLRRDLSFDGIDPNEAGYRLMTGAVDTLLAALP